MSNLMTIGHSTHSLGDFISLLRWHDISAVVDVRSAPSSRYAPQYNRDAISRSLRMEDIHYVYMGDSLGARPKDQSCYDDTGKVSYGKIADSVGFCAAIDRLVKGSQIHRIALMCSEKDPMHCHRTFLVADALVQRGLSVEHILADGSAESHQDLTERVFLSDKHFAHADFFASPSDLAFARQSHRIAYVQRAPQPAQYVAEKTIPYKSKAS